MMPFYTAQTVGCKLFRAAVIVMLTCVISQLCLAAKLRQRPTTGVYLTRDAQQVRSLAQHTPGAYWIDGYQMVVSSETRVCWHNAPLKFSSVLNGDDQSFPRLSKTSSCESAPVDSVVRNAWLQYLGVQRYEGYYWLAPVTSVIASRIDIWRNDDGRDGAQGTPRQTWRELCASTSPHELNFPNEGPIDVVCDGRVNSFVENLFSSLLRRPATTSDAPIAKREVPSFYVVKPFEVRRNYDFEVVAGLTAICGLQGTLCKYQYPRAHSMVRNIVFAPDGTILIADAGFAHLANEAEFAALLSYSLAATEQNLVRRLFRAQRFRAGRWSSSGDRNGFRIWQFTRSLNEQVLRLGMSQMYEAGYDIRYTPLAWSVERGKRTKGPLTVPDYRHMPWYAAYAFNYISQYYKDVDYSKLKRGRKEYQQFLQDLRKADPEAFAGQASGPKQAARAH